jgi:hypothetical protein
MQLKMKRIYNKNLLKNVIERDMCSINLNDYLVLNRNIKIAFICNCGEKHIKPFRGLFEQGALCINCMYFKSKSKRETTNLEIFGVKYPSQSEHIIKSMKQTNLRRYKTEYPIQLKEFKDKTKQTNIKRYGVENVAQLDKTKEKMKQTNLKKYDVKYPIQLKEFKDKTKQTNIKRYGVENVAQLDKTKDKTKQTNLKKYGVKHPLQNSEIAEKVHNSYKPKLYEFPNGDIIKIQGYEPFAINILLKFGYNQNDIVTSKLKVPEIWYKDTENKLHRYYCDIFIPSENKIIEVKSEWTYKNYLHTNILKSETCKEEGYDFEFWIIDKNGNYKIIYP